MTGQVLHADGVSVSCDEPVEFTVDWVIHINMDVFDWTDFNGNKVYIRASPISLIVTVLCTYYLIAQG